MTRRLPTATRARIAPLARLPLFHALHGRFVVLAGHGEGAAWKAELLGAAGAEVRVFVGSEPAVESLVRLAAAPIDGRVILHQRGWEAADLAGAALAVGDFEDDVQAGAFAAAARAGGIPVNCVDRPQFCDFAFGSIVNRSPMVIGISTDGAAPIFGQSLRARIESLVPAGFARWAEAARDWRPAVMDRLDKPARRAFWERFTRAAWEAPERAPDAVLRDRLLDVEGPQGGSVTLVGAGPGDPELLTLKALRALQSASVILYDDLVGQPILDLARREALRIAVGKRGGQASCRQDDINARMVALALEGHRVVRLKGGDPLVFGRANEELDACREAGVPVSIVPGITAAQGAAATLGFSLTHREKARRLQLVTGHGANGALPGDIDWQAVADPATTTAIYMGRATIGDFLARALAAGLDPETPAFAVASATLPGQAEVRAPAARLAAAIEALPRGPVVVILGQAIDHAREIALSKAA